MWYHSDYGREVLTLFIALDLSSESLELDSEQVQENIEGWWMEVITGGEMSAGVQTQSRRSGCIRVRKDG